MGGPRLADTITPKHLFAAACAACFGIAVKMQRSPTLPKDQAVALAKESTKWYVRTAMRRAEMSICLWSVFLLYTMWRVNCRRRSAAIVEEVPWGDGKRALTKADLVFLAR